MAGGQTKLAEYTCLGCKKAQRFVSAVWPPTFILCSDCNSWHEVLHDDGRGSLVVKLRGRF